MLNREWGGAGEQGFVAGSGHGFERDRGLSPASHGDFKRKKRAASPLVNDPSVADGSLSPTVPGLLRQVTASAKSLLFLLWSFEVPLRATRG